MIIALKIILTAIIFILTGGAVFANWGQRHKVLMLAAAIFALVSSFYVMRSLYDDFEQDVASEIGHEAPTQSASKKSEAEEVGHLTVGAKPKEVKETKQKQLKALFDTTSYSDGVVLIGAASQQKDKISLLATKKVVDALLNSLQQKSVPVDEFRPQVYLTGNFERLLNGKFAMLDEAGLSKKMRAALIANVHTSCRPSISELTSCAVAADIRLLKSMGTGALWHISETSVGATAEQAVIRAVEQIAERHGYFFFEKL